MNRRILKRVAFVLALALCLGLGWFANAFLGNPLSQFLARRTARAHLESVYADTDFVLERVSYSFKSTSYYAYISSPSSIDTEFTLRIDMWGRLYLDTYDSVLAGYNTARRLDEEYRERADALFDSPTFPYSCRICYGTLEIYPQEAFAEAERNGVPEYAIVQETLELDRVYDIAALGAQAGKLVLYLDVEDVSFDNAAAILLDIRAVFDRAGVPFRAVDLMLNKPKGDADEKFSDEVIWAENFLYDAITADGLAQRIEDAHNATAAYYESMDK